MSNVDVYEATRRRIVTLVEEGDGDVPVPTCPGWTVKDVVAHLAGSLDCYISGKLEGASSPEWGDHQVKERQDRSLDECFAEWAGYEDASGKLFESKLGSVAVADVLAHEQDIRTALGRPGERDAAGILDAVELALSFIDHKARAADLPALKIVTEDLEKVVGDGQPAATLRTSTFELFRSVHGRRTPDQVRSLDWDGDPAPWMEVFFIFGPADVAVRE